MSACLTMLALVVHRNPDLRDEDLPERQLFSFVATTAGLVVAFGLALIPGVRYLALLMLFLPPAIERVRYRGATR